MNILHVETGRHLYGGGLQVLYLMRGLKERGHHNLLACPINSAIAGFAEQDAHSVYELPMGGDLDFFCTFRLGRIIREAQPQIVHVHSRRGADLWGGIAACSHGAKAVVSRRVDNPEPKWLARFKYRMFDRVIAISNGIRKVLLTEGVPFEKIVCVPDGVDTERYQPVGDRNWFRREFGLLPDEKAIAVVAQLIERKGHRYMIEAAQDIIAHYENVRILFFGQGPLHAELARLCQRTGLAERVEFPGFRDDLERIFPCLDMIVHPATMEGMGVSLLQAAVCGVPIVASRVGGIPEIVEHGTNGWLVPAGDSRAIAEAVLDLLKNPERANHFRKAGITIARERFCIDRMVQGNLQVYLDLLYDGSVDGSSAMTAL